MGGKNIETNQAQIPNILMVAGEASGDVLGGGLLEELIRMMPGTRAWGIGGRLMAQSGFEQVHDVKDLGVTGFSEVIRKLPAIIKIFNNILTETDRRSPDLAILIDYPDFNLRLAKRLKRRGIPVVYYVSPQMWAWRSGRVNLVRQYIDTMMVLFPFEEHWYRERGAEAVFVGHPVLDRIKQVPDRISCRTALGIKEDEFLIAVLPGSRTNEVNRMLPTMLQCQQRLTARETELQQTFGRRIRFVLPLADTISADALPVDTENGQRLPQIVSGNTLEVIRAADFAWVTSGTASLETALLLTPQVVTYKTSAFSFFLAKNLIDLNYISIANLVGQEAVATELIQNDFNVDALLAETIQYLDPTVATAQIEKLKSLQTLFGDPGASRRAASAVMNTVKLLKSSTEESE